MLWVKTFHIFFMVTWFSGLFYLPRLYVYHTMAADTLSIERFKIMERKLYFGIATPGALLTILFGLWLAGYNWQYYMHMKWFHYKLTFVLIALFYHFYLGKVYFNFKKDRNKRSHGYYRIINEIPVLFLFAIIALVVIKPFSQFYFLPPSNPHWMRDF